MMLNVNGKDYRAFRVESIHEEDTFVECRDVASNELQCEIRIDRQRRAYLMPTSVEIDLEMLLALTEYVKAL